MPNEDDIWTPGSFTKNFSWGKASAGLSQLYHVIRLGFAETMQDVPRATFRERVSTANRPDFIPLNFFLFNRPKDGIDHIIADELVFEAINFEHSRRFDKLAVFALNLSLVGTWIGAAKAQRRPALWANFYIRKRIADQNNWNTKLVSADDIEQFVTNDARYKAKNARKLSTNLNYIYTIGKLSEFEENRVERWWVNALFLALDRIIEEKKLDGLKVKADLYATLLSDYDFIHLAGKRSLEKDLATKHLVALYAACGGRDRFSEEDVIARIDELLPDIERFLANDPRPRGAVHPTNPRILKSIPRVCAMLAKYIARFDVIDPDELENFDSDAFIRSRTHDALRQLQEKEISPTMTAEELFKMTRER